MPPPEPTLLDRLVEAGRQVHAVGKIGDIFAHKGISTLAKANGNDALFDATLVAMDQAEDGDLVFAVATGTSGIALTPETLVEFHAAAGATMARAIARGVYEATPGAGDLMPVWSERRG